MPDGRSPDSKELGFYLTLAQVGVEMVVPLVAGLFVDEWLGTAPWLIIAGVVFGFVGGIAHIVVLTNKHDADGKRRKN